MNIEKSVDCLNKLLRVELSATETYRMAGDKVKDPAIVQVLREVLASHETRVNLLRAQISRLGGKPAEGSGVWGAWARLVQGSAGIREDAVIAVLEEGEDIGLRAYTDNDELADLDSQSRRYVDRELLPGQERTHAVMSAIEHRKPADV